MEGLLKEDQVEESKKEEKIKKRGTERAEKNGKHAHWQNEEKLY